MMGRAPLNRVKETTVTTGTGTVTLSGTAVSPYQKWSSGGAQSGIQYPYLIEQGSDSEWGLGTLTNTAGTWTMSRDVVSGSIISGAPGTTKLTLTGSATVACVDLAPGSVPVVRGHTFTGVKTVTSGTIAIPAGSQAGDLAVFMAVGGDTLGLPGITVDTFLTYGGWWQIAIYTKTLTSADITAGSFNYTWSASFGNYLCLSVFGAGTRIAAWGGYMHSQDNSGGGITPSNTPCCALTGETNYNPNMYWVISTSARGITNTQSWSARVSTWAYIGQSNNANGTCMFAWAYFTGLPMWTGQHGAEPPQPGNFGLGFLGP